MKASHEIASAQASLEVLMERARALCRNSKTIEESEYFAIQYKQLEARYNALLWVGENSAEEIDILEFDQDF